MTGISPFDKICYLINPSVSILASVQFTVISTPAGLSSSPLQWLMTTPIRLHNKCWVLCSLAQLSLSCKVSDLFLHGWPLSKEHSFRLHGVTSCQIIWFFRTQSGRSSKSMIALVRLCHCISKDETIQVSCRSSSSGLYFALVRHRRLELTIP